MPTTTDFAARRRDRARAIRDARRLIAEARKALDQIAARIDTAAAANREAEGRPNDSVSEENARKALWDAAFDAGDAVDALDDVTGGLDSLVDQAS